METPSEWAKKFSRPKTGGQAAPPEADAKEGPRPAAEFPGEPFQCPACGQLLAPSCRVCVACKHVIDPAEIARLPVVATPRAYVPTTEPTPEPVPYPWRIFFEFLGVSFLLALVLEMLLGQQTAQLAMGGLQTLAGVWVFYDGTRQRIPHSLRWGVGTMLLPVVVFPWYVARRKKPRSAVPFVEAEVGRATRFLLIALLFFILGSLIFYLVQNPPAKTPPAPKVHPTNGSSPSRITDIGPQRRDGQHSWRAGLPWNQANSATRIEAAEPLDDQPT